MNYDSLRRRLIEWCTQASDDDVMPQELLDEWPNCSVPDCPNKASLRLRSDKCHPHTEGDTQQIASEWSEPRP